MKAAVITFPGSNCDRDAYSALTALSNLSGSNTKPSDIIKVWHGDASLPKVDLVVLPGGFSYGDYLRSGAMAGNSPIMKEVVAHANRGGLTLGICNGFQVLTEAGLVPGVLLRNAGLKFVCKPVNLRVESTATAFTKNYTQGQVINIPVAHHDGNYFAADDTLKAMEDNDQIAFRYCTDAGDVTADANPNGSLSNIAGVFNDKKNVLGMMPHPERHADAMVGGADGAPMFTGLLAA